ncbi:MAG: glycoside hydrolase [Cypionkella sp.]|uniref:glycoside hydrolase family 25 protein n=1 Tax=Cypionkella sp. TaxID=2811411 RepID=UPI00260169FB|nr:GH25 family lysozyme [Cypionkella sp.]MDB5659932.1 glycoside hydrolase [Cypionkella sp.]MDB5664133.1 glycoside hydrolase [Cypionkella sp.]
MRYTLALLLLITLAACGGGRREIHESTSSPTAAPSRANFGDANPQDFGRVSPQSHRVHGIDVSKFQPSIDWPTARANGVSFAFIKATEGGDQSDPLFDQHWSGAARAGIPRGAYHFYYHCRPAIEQARWFIAHVPRSTAALPPVLDMEWTPTSPTCRVRNSPEHIRAEAQIFISALRSHYGKRPILYTAIDFFEDNQMWQVQGADFWLRSVKAHPQDLYAGHSWTFWQYSGTGQVPGIPGKTDLNAFAGSTRDWDAWLAANHS